MQDAPFELDPQYAGTNKDFFLSLWLFPVTRLVGLGVTRSTRLRSRRKGWFEGGNWCLPRLVCAETNQGWSRWERGLLLMRLKRQDFVLGCWLL